MTEKTAIALTDAMYDRGLVSLGDLTRLADFRTRPYSQKRPLVYGAIGGSITAGASAQPGHAYAPLLAEHLKQKHEVTFVNAGIGASNSLFGTFRLQKDLLVHKPDLVTVEYAVNDANNPEIALAYESLIRQCLMCESQPLVILIFTMRRDASNVQDIHIPIGRHYDLPMLSYRDAVYPEIAAGNWIWEDISPDEVHPNDDGHRMMCEMFTRYLHNDQVNSHHMHCVPRTSEGQQYVLPELMAPQASRYMNGRIYDASMMQVLHNDGWTFCKHKGGYTGFESQTPGAELHVRFTGNLAYLGYQKYAGDFGQVQVTLDGKDMGIFDGHYEKPLIQAWAGGHTVIDTIASELADGEHELHLKLLEQTHPQSHGHKFDIGYLLVS
jgi:lysophospholipase L1-like esterase